MPEPPVACSLSTPELAARRATLLAQLAERSLRRGEVEDGLFFELPGDEAAADLVAEVLRAERRCCRFLGIAVTYAPDFGPIRLELTGPPGAREVVREMFGR